VVRQKKCYNCLLSTSICECYNLFFYSLTPDNIEENSFSNNKYRTILKGSFSSDSCLFLKKRLGCGGNYYRDRIEIQGKHKDKILAEISNL